MKPGASAGPPVERLVVNASTLVSGVASRPSGGAPWLILAALLDFDFEAIVCPRLIGEFRDALTNKYFSRALRPDELAEIVANDLLDHQMPGAPGI